MLKTKSVIPKATTKKRQSCKQHTGDLKESRDIALNSILQDSSKTHNSRGDKLAPVDGKGKARQWLKKYALWVLEHESKAPRGGGQVSALKGASLRLRKRAGECITWLYIREHKNTEGL